MDFKVSNCHCNLKINSFLSVLEYDRTVCCGAMHLSVGIAQSAWHKNLFSVEDFFYSGLAPRFTVALQPTNSKTSFRKL
jgi:hypothetical protein